MKKGIMIITDYKLFWTLLNWFLGPLGRIFGSMFRPGSYLGIKTLNHSLNPPFITSLLSPFCVFYCLYSCCLGGDIVATELVGHQMVRLAPSALREPPDLRSRCARNGWLALQPSSWVARVAALVRQTDLGGRLTYWQTVMQVDRHRHFGSTLVALIFFFLLKLL